MDTLLALKPVLTALVLPAASGWLCVAMLSIWAWRRSAKQRAPSARAPLAVMLLCAAAMWLLSCPAVAVYLATHLLPQVAATTPEALKNQHVQAIVVLGGGVEPHAPEYNSPNLKPDSMARLLYGRYLAQRTQLPLAYSGGVGWAGVGSQASEAEVAQQALTRLGGPNLRWQEGQSRDTRENAQFSAQLLKADGVTRIALVTHAWHMPRSVRQFEAAGLVVMPAPMGFIHSDERPVLQWLPSASGLRDSAWVLREWLGQRLT